MLHTHNILNRVYPASVVLFFVFAISIIFPFSGVTDNADATITQSTTTLTLSNANVDLDLTVDNLTDAFAASTPADFTVTTNNYTGYTLSILAATSDANATKLVNTKNSEYVFNSISSASTESEFNVGNWGYLPSKLNSAVNTKYQPAPTSAGTTLDVTSAANSTANSYSITLGAKAGSSTPAGSYINSFTLSAVANPVTYSITYNKNTTDTVTNMPSNQSGNIGDTDIKLSSNTPTRTGYTFQGWCTTTPTTSNGVDSCSGTTYQPGATYNTNKTTANNTTLHALWKIDTFTQTTQVRYEVANADGTYGSYTTVDTKTVNYGASYSWSTSQISGFNTNTYNSASVAAYTVTEAHTNQVNITRKSYVLTVNRNTSYISSVSGAGTYKVGKVVSISATASSGNKFTGWSQTAGTTSSFGSTSSASTTFTMPASAATIYANGTVACSSTISGYMQNIGTTSSYCDGASGTMTDSRDNKTYTVAKINGLIWMTKNLNIAGGTTLTSAKSNVSSSYTLPASSTAGFDDNAKAFVYNDSAYGGYYSWVAATAGTNPSPGDSTYDICPKGWHLPSRANYNTLKSTYTTGATLTAAPWYGAYGGNYSYGSANNVGSRGLYWSSTARNSYDAYYFYLNSSSADTGYTRKSGGYSVRCIAK